MTNLPITSNSTLPAGKAANATPGNGAAEDAQAATGAGGAAPFAEVLARQIGGADAALLNIVQISIGAEASGNGPTSDSGDAPDPATITAGTGSSEAANSVMSILLQIPQEMRPSAQNAADSTAASAMGKNGAPGEVDIATLKATPLSADTPAGMTDPAEMARDGSLGRAGITVTGQQIAPEALTQNLPQEGVKQAELPASLVPSAPANAVQTIAPSALAAALPNMQPGKTGDTPQTITTPLGNSSWSDEFSQKISWMGTQQNQVAELHLNPPDLGPLDVVLKISDNQATALFTSPHGAVREAVENALPKLREMLADNGITLGNTTVSDQPPRDREAQESAAQGPGTGKHGGNGGSAKAEGALTSAAAAARRHNGMVDTFA